MTRIGVTRTSPKAPSQKRPSTPLWVTWRPRGDDDPRPWVSGDSEPLSNDTRYVGADVIELTDVSSMVMNRTNIQAVIDFVGAPGDIHGCRVRHDEFGVCIWTYGQGEVWLGQGTTVWRLPDGRCYIQHKVSPRLMFVWPPMEVEL